MHDHRWLMGLGSAIVVGPPVSACASVPLARTAADTEGETLRHRAGQVEETAGRQGVSECRRAQSGFSARRMTPGRRALIERSRESAGLVRRVVENAPPARFAAAPRPGEWSAPETLTHLRDVVAHVHGLRIRRPLHEDAPVLADFDEEGYRRASLARGGAIGGLLETIVAEPEQLERPLRPLSDADWARTGRPPSFAVSIEVLASRAGEPAEEQAAQIAETTRAR